jgi:3-oxoacyl-[acyl-carrier-protein] synthase-3
VRPCSKTRILGTGSYLPEKVLTNKDLEKKVDTSDKWIITRTGIRERRIASRHQATSDLALLAALPALEAAKVKAKDLRLIMVATCTPDSPMPSTACHLQNLLGAKKAAAFDLNAACSGFVYGLSVADSMIRSGAAENCLLVGAELFSRFVNWGDRGTCILFADGAGAVVMAPSGRSRSELLSTDLYADGALPPPSSRRTSTRCT